MMNDIAATWDASPSPEQWAASNKPSDTLLWKGGVPRQVSDLVAIAHILDANVRIAGHHTSKSVRLPVGLFRFDVANEETIYIVTRDNFYDMKAVVISSCPFVIDYGLIYTEMTAEALAAERQTAYDYRSKNTNFDPTVFDTDSWMVGWISGTILRANGKIYRCGTTASCYYEGMEEAGVPREAFERYEHGRHTLAVQVDGPIGFMRLVQAVRESVLDAVRLRRDKARTLEVWRKFVNLLGRRPHEDAQLVEATDKLRAWGMLPENAP